MTICVTDKSKIKNGYVFKYNDDYYVKLGKYCAKLVSEECGDMKMLIFDSFDKFNQENITAIFKSDSKLLEEDKEC